MARPLLHCPTASQPPRLTARAQAAPLKPALRAGLLLPSRTGPAGWTAPAQLTLLLLCRMAWAAAAPQQASHASKPLLRVAQRMQQAVAILLGLRWKLPTLLQLQLLSAAKQLQRCSHSTRMRLLTAKLQQPRHRHSTHLLLLLVTTAPLVQTSHTLSMLSVPVVTPASRNPSRLLLLLKAARQHKLWAPNSSQPKAVVVSRTRPHCRNQRLGSKQSSSRKDAHRRHRVTRQFLPRSKPQLPSRRSMRLTSRCPRRQDRVSGTQGCRAAAGF